VEAPALAPPEVAYDQNDMIRYEQELTEAAAMPLPDVRRELPVPSSLSILCLLVVAWRSLSFPIYLFGFGVFAGGAILGAHFFPLSFLIFPHTGGWRLVKQQ